MTSIKDGYNSLANLGMEVKASVTAPVQSLLSNISKVMTQPVTASHGIDATKPVDLGQCQAAKQSLSAAKEQNGRTLAAVQKDADVAKREIDNAGAACGQGGGGAFERTQIAGSEGGLLLSAVAGAAPIGKGSFATALNKGLEAASATDQIGAIMDDRKVSSDEAKAEIADVLIRSSQPEPETSDFGFKNMIADANKGERIQVTNDYAAIDRDFGADGIEEIYNLDVENPSSAFPELQALQAANTDLDSQLAEVIAIEAGMVADISADAVGAFPLPAAGQVEAGGVSMMFIASLPADEREAIIRSGADVSEDLEDSLKKAATNLEVSTNGMMA